jgi:DNA mismatch repair protein MutH
MENKLTAVDWLITQLEGEESLVARIVGLKEYNQIVKQAKQMEKEQIEKAFQDSMVDIVLGKMSSPKEYYNETYGE